MAITRQNVLAHEWIGLQVTVDSSPDPSLNAVSGVVRDETKNTLTVETTTGRVMLPKFHAAITATLPSGEKLKVQGDLLRVRPEDRIKKRLNKW